MDGSKMRDGAPTSSSAAEVNTGLIANSVSVSGDQIINVGGRLQWTKEADLDGLIETERKLDQAIRLWSFRAFVPVFGTFFASIFIAAGTWGLMVLADPGALATARNGYIALGVALTCAVYASILWVAVSESRRRNALLDTCAARQWAEVRVELAMRGHYGKSDQRVLALMNRKYLSTRMGGLIGVAVWGDGSAREGSCNGSRGRE